MTDLHLETPDPLASIQQYTRFYHYDIAEMGDMELGDELRYLEASLWQLDDNHWLRQRVEMIQLELTKRQGDTNYGTRQHQIPKQAEGVEL